MQLNRPKILRTREKTNESDDSFSYDWYGVANTNWDVIHTIKNDWTLEDLDPKAQKIFEYYENKYGKSDLDSTVIDSIIGDLKDTDLINVDFHLKNLRIKKISTKCFKMLLVTQKKMLKKIPLTLARKTLTKKGIDVEKPNNIILPDNN